MRKHNLLNLHLPIRNSAHWVETGPSQYPFPVAKHCLPKNIIIIRRNNRITHIYQGEGYPSFVIISMLTYTILCKSRINRLATLYVVVISDATHKDCELNYIVLICFADFLLFLDTNCNMIYFLPIFVCVFIMRFAEEIYLIGKQELLLYISRIRI